MGIRIALAVAGLAAGVGLTRWYDRSPKAHKFVNWWFKFDVRASDPHIYRRKRA